MKPQRRKKNKNTIVGRNKTVVLLVLFCITIGAMAMVAAKYIHDTNTTNGATAKEFYFTSDILSKTGTTHEVTALEANQTATVTFQLMNHADSLRYSEVNIKYTVSVREKGGATLDSSKIENQTGTISGNQVNNANVTIKGLEPGKEYIVTATTDNTYKQTLRGTIKVKKADDNVYASVKDKNNYIEVTVWTIDHTGEVSLTYQNTGLIPDNTDTKMENAKRTDDTLKFTDWAANTSHVFRFFKQNTDTSKIYEAKVNETEVTISEK